MAARTRAGTDVRNLALRRRGIKLRLDSLQLIKQRKQLRLLDRRRGGRFAQSLNALAPIRHRPCDSAVPVSGADHPCQMFDFPLDERLRDVGEVGLLNHGRAPGGNSGWRTLCVFPNPSRMSLHLLISLISMQTPNLLRRRCGGNCDGLIWLLASAFQTTVPSPVPRAAMRTLYRASGATTRSLFTVRCRSLR